MLTGAVLPSHARHVCVCADAAHSKCRVAATPLTQEDIAVDYNQHNIEYTPANISFPGHMRIRMEGSSGARVQPKAPRQMYGQFEVTAKVDSAAGAVTAFYVSARGGLSCWLDVGAFLVRMLVRATRVSTRTHTCGQLAWHKQLQASTASCCDRGVAF